MKDEWTDLADFLKEMIEKYFDTIDFDEQKSDILVAK